MIRERAENKRFGGIFCGKSVRNTGKMLCLLMDKSLAADGNMELV